MWAYTDNEIDYLSTFRLAPVRSMAAGSLRAPTSRPSPAANSGAIRSTLALPLPKWLKTWLQRQADRLELSRLDDRSLSDLGINRGDFPAILAGTYSHGGEIAEPARSARGIA